MSTQDGPRGGRRRILFVGGIEHDARARDVGREFERYGPIVRCDIPLPGPGAPAGRALFAFVEFEDHRDAEDAFDDMHGRRTAVGRLSVEWARRPPPKRFEDEERARRRSRSPARRSRSPARRSPQRRSKSPARRSRSPGRRSPHRVSARESPRMRSGSPSRSVSPPRV